MYKLSIRYINRLYLFIFVTIICLIAACDSEAEKEHGKSDKELALEDPQKFLKEALNQAIPGSMDRGYTKSMEPVDISLIDDKTDHTLRMRIPKAYITNKKNWEGGKQQSLWLQAVMPDMKPVDHIDISKTNNEEVIEKRIEKNSNRLFIRLNSIYTDNVVNENFHQRYERDYIRQPELVFGLIHYKRAQRCIDPATTDDPRVTEGNHCFDVGHEYFMSPEIVDDEWVRYDCVRLEQNPGGGCSALVFYKNKGLRYIFRRNQLHRWKKIDRSIRDILDSFVIEE